MKKILTIALMLCIFTAMAVGTAAAKENNKCFTSITANQKIDAAGKCVALSQDQIAGTASVDKIKVGCLNICDAKLTGTSQNQCVQLTCGYACATECTNICIVA